MEAYIRIFSDHFTAMITDVDSQTITLQRSFSYLEDAYVWLAERGFDRSQVAEYDWRITESAPATITL